MAANVKQDGTQNKKKRTYHYDKEEIIRIAKDKNTRGADGILTKELLHKEILPLLEHHVFVSTICEYIGIEESTWYRWVSRGKIEAEEDFPEELRSIYFDFYKFTRRSVSKGEIFLNMKLQEMANGGDLQAIRYIMSHRYRRNWSDTPEPDKSVDTSNDPFIQMLDRLRDEAKDRQKETKTTAKDKGKSQTRTKTAAKAQDKPKTEKASKENKETAEKAHANGGPGPGAYSVPATAQRMQHGNRAL